MVGRFTLAGLRMRAQHVTSHDSSDSRSRNESVGSTSYFSPIRRQVPLIASPLDPKTTEWLQGKRDQNNLTLKRRPTVAQYEANKASGGMFRKQAEASPLELFFDLFFVANLAVFTYNHECNSEDGRFCYRKLSVHRLTRCSNWQLHRVFLYPLDILVSCQYS